MTRPFAASVLVTSLVAYAPALRSQTATAAAGQRPAAPFYSLGQPPIWRQQLTAQATAFTQTGGGRGGGPHNKTKLE